MIGAAGHKEGLRAVALMRAALYGAFRFFTSIVVLIVDPDLSITKARRRGGSPSFPALLYMLINGLLFLVPSMSSLSLQFSLSDLL